MDASEEPSLTYKIIHYIAFVIYLAAIVITEVFYRESLFNSSCNWIENIQKNTKEKFWDTFWEVITTLGTQAVLLPMFFIIYVFKNIKLSYMYLSILSLSVFIDNVMKNIYANPRPYMINLDIEIKHCDAGYGNPSGHSFSSSANYLAFFHIMTDVDFFKNSLSKKFIRAGIGILTSAFAIAIMFSRFFLGVHTLNQLIYGCLCGIGLYYFYFFLIRFQHLSDKEFFDLFYKKAWIIFHSVLFISFILVNFGLYFFNTHDTSEWNKLIEKHCPSKPIYRRFDNDAGINSLTIFAMIGAYIGILIIVHWRSSIDTEGERLDDLNNWNKTNWLKWLYRLIITLVLTAVGMSLYILISSNAHLGIIIPFKVIVPFFLAGIILYGLVIFISIRCKIANENFDTEVGGFANKLNAKDEV